MNNKNSLVFIIMKLSKFLSEQVSRGDNPVYWTLVDYRDGKLTEEDVMRDIPEIVKIKKNAVMVEFDDYWDMFDTDNDYHGAYWAKVTLNYYDTPQYIDYDIVSNDWDEGYLFDYFTPKQKKKLLYLMSKVDESYLSCNLSADSDCTHDIIKIIDDHFDASGFIDEIVEARNTLIRENLKKELMTDFRVPLPRSVIRMEPVVDHQKFITSLNELIKLAENYGEDKENLSQIVNRAIEEFGWGPNFEDGFWEYENRGDLELNGIQRSVDQMLESIEEGIDDETIGPTLEYLKFLKDFNTSERSAFKLKGDGKYNQAIIWRFLNDKVDLDLQNTQTGRSERFRVPLDAARNLLTTYSLF